MPEVAIIGGGPAGFASARAIAAEKRDLHVTIFERQAVAGGCWNYGQNGPMYRDLVTNVPKEFMGFRDYPLPDELPTYVKGPDVAAYFQNYSAIVAQDDAIDVQFGATVVDVTKQAGEWTVELADGRKHTSDFLLVASGHYEHPSFGTISGLQEFRAAHPGIVKHSIDYDAPEPFTGRSVLIVGNASSGIDLAIQILGVTDRVTLSRRTPGKSDGLFEGGDDITLKPATTKFVPETQEVEFEDGSRGVYDDVIIATGYQWRYPFLDTFNAQQERPFLIPPNYHRLQNLYQYIFFVDDPTLAFVMINRMILPVPWVESQAAVVARAWSGRISLPSSEEMRATDAALVSEKGYGESYLTLAFPEDHRFIDFYKELAESSGIDDGFHARDWDPERLERRAEAMPKKFLDFKRKVAESRARRAVLTLANANTQFDSAASATRIAEPAANQAVLTNS